MSYWQLEREEDYYYNIVCILYAISLSLIFLQDLLHKVNDLVSEQKKDVRFGVYSTVEVRMFDAHKTF